MADQFYYSKSIIVKSLELGKLYFSENPIADLFTHGLKVLEKNIKLYNNLVDQEMFNTVANKEQSLEEELQKTQILEFQKLKKKNERVNEIFNAAQELVFWATKYTF